MAELEVAKHTKKVVSIIGSKQGWLHKLKEVVFEIAIIVFAVSLSIWFHNRSEQHHGKEEATLFLEGLRNDLQGDVLQMKEDLISYDSLLKSSAYFQTLFFADTLNYDSLKTYRKFLFNTTRLTPNNSRFEGFKVSGKLNTIEDKALLNDILYFYQHNLTFIELLNNGFNNYKTQRLGILLDQRLVVDRAGNGNWLQLFHEPEVQNALRRSREVDQIMREYQAAIVTARRIILQIEKNK